MHTNKYISRSIQVKIYYVILVSTTHFTHNEIMDIEIVALNVCGLRSKLKSTDFEEFIHKFKPKTKFIWKSEDAALYICIKIN